MAQLAELAMPVVSTAAGFQRHLAGGQLREILQHPLTSECLADYHTPAPVDPCSSKICFAISRPILVTFTLGPSRSSLRWRDCHRWLTMKPLNTGWVHPINEAVRTAGPTTILDRQQFARTFPSAY